VGQTDAAVGEEWTTATLVNMVLVAGVLVGLGGAAEALVRRGSRGGRIPPESGR
jgi:hypothetical protein